MKVFNVSNFLAGLKVVSLLGAIALFSPTEAIAQPGIDDQNFLSDLYSFLQSEDSLSHELAYAMGDDMNMMIAQSVCQELSSGRSPQSLYAEFNAGVVNSVPDPEIYNQIDYSTGLYIGSIMNLGSAYYCPQYQPRVVQALQSL